MVEKLRELHKINNLLEETQNNDLIENKIIENSNDENIEIYDIKFENAIFNNVNMLMKYNL